MKDAKPVLSPTTVAVQFQDQLFKRLLSAAAERGVSPGQYLWAMAAWHLPVVNQETEAMKLKIRELTKENSALRASLSPGE